MRSKRICDNCKHRFAPTHGNQFYCTVTCRKNARYERRQQGYERRQQDKTPVYLDCNTKGAKSELRAAIDLLDRGWMVFRNMTPSGGIDVVAVARGEHGIMLRIEVRTRADNTKHKAADRSRTGYKQGKHYDHLAVVDHEGNIRYYPDLPEVTYE